jgi:GntR family transcriptional repressor for pyruvate dehydrogenase complex
MADFKLQRVETVRIFEQAVDQLRELIYQGALAPEQKLPTEQELSRQFHIGRSSIREALRVLESEGLVEVRRGSGTYVTANPMRLGLKSEVIGWLAQQRESLVQILEVRESIEGLTASLAAANCSDELIAQLRQNIDALSPLVDRIEENNVETIDQVSRLDAAFHLLIGQASGNDLAEEILARIIPAFTESNKAMVYVRRGQRAMEAEHREILHSIQARDPQAAEKAMRAHIARVRDEIPGWMEGN